MCVLVLNLVLIAGSMAQHSPSAPSYRGPAANAATPQSTSDAGEQVFRRNCSRCHKAPEAIPPSIAATVALHMRIRAGLSEKDYRRLLVFLNAQ
jgi:cytochrome c5